ncbi:ATP-binding cassette domain-containing protein [Vagococcus hydrophili]|nr:ATP-binding cassette domain-containing protein [Vagococcus hydrophili]
MEKKIIYTNVSKKIKKDMVLDNISLSLDMGRNYGIYGTNGSGKTMFLRSICGLMTVKGNIQIDTVKDIGNKNFPNSLGLLIENPSFINEFTGFENLKLLSFISKSIGDDTINQVITTVGLNPKDKRKYKKYSLGMKQRLGIAQAIIGSPDLIVLDEPTNGLDEDGISLLIKIIHSMEESTFIIASHDKEFLKHVTQTHFKMAHGKLNEASLW